MTTLDKLLDLANRGRKMVRRPENRGSDWYRISNANGERAELFIYGVIGDDWLPEDVTAAGFTRALRDITAPVIDLHVNSPGGLVFDGIAIYSALLNHAATIDVSVDGIAASAASFITQAGDSIAIEKPAHMMIHDAGGITLGNADDHREMAELLDELSDTIAEIYADRAGGTVESWREAMKTETWYGADEAVAAGLADRVANDTTEKADSKADNHQTSTPAPVRGSQRVFAQAGTNSQKGKGMDIAEIMAALKAIIDGAEGRTLTDEEVKRYEQLENDLAQKRTEAVKARQHAYEAPVRDNVQAAVQAAPAREDGDLEKAFDHYLRTGRPNADIADLRISNAQQVGTDSEGGYLVPDGFRQKLVEVRSAFGGLAAEVDSFSTETGNPIEFPSLDDTANEGAITAEEAAFADGDDLAFGTVNLGAFKYTSTGAGTTTPLRVSVELLQDSAFDIQGLVARKLGERIARKQATDWVTGAGTTLPFGIAHTGLTADHELATIDTITYADLLAIEAALDPAYEQTAKWVMSKATWTGIRSVEDGNGRPLILEQAQSGMGGAPQRTLLGYPVVIDQAFAAFDSAAGAHFAVLGDLREAYVIRRVSNLVVVVNPWTRMNNGQIEYVAWERADGNIQNRSAYALAMNNDGV